MWSGCWVVISSGIYLCARNSASLASSHCCCSWYITKMMVITTYIIISLNIIWLYFVSHLFLKFWQKNVVYKFPCTNESVSLSDLYSLSLSHTVFAVSLILILHNILFDCNSTVFSLLLILLFLGHTIYFAMLKKLQDSLIPYSTNVESIVKHSILSFKNQTDCQNSYAQSLLYSTKAETEPKTMISIFLLSH